MEARDLVLVVALSTALAGMALGQERTISRKQLPPKVDQAVSGLTKNATLRGLTQETKEGQTFYEAELLVNGHSKDVLMDANGNPVEVEEQIALTDMPPSVQRRLQEQTRDAEIMKIESLTKQGKVVAYEVALKNGEQHSEFQIGPDGEKLTHPE